MYAPTGGRGAGACGSVAVDKTTKLQGEQLPGRGFYSSGGQVCLQRRSSLSIHRCVCVPITANRCLPPQLTACRHICNSSCRNVACWASQRKRAEKKRADEKQDRFLLVLRSPAKLGQVLGAYPSTRHSFGTLNHTKPILCRERCHKAPTHVILRANTLQVYSRS
jgi:hypothetical protein